MIRRYLAVVGIVLATVLALAVWLKPPLVAPLASSSA